MLVVNIIIEIISRVIPRQFGMNQIMGGVMRLYILNHRLMIPMVEIFHILSIVLSVHVMAMMEILRVFVMFGQGSIITIQMPIWLAFTMVVTE